VSARPTYHGQQGARHIKAHQPSIKRGGRDRSPAAATAWRHGPPKVRPIRVDDKTADDRYDGFCRITVSFPDPNSDEFELALYNVPWNKDVQAVAEELDGEWVTPTWDEA
jgi:hypothetical protein